MVIYISSFLKNQTINRAYLQSHAARNINGMEHEKHLLTSQEVFIEFALLQKLLNCLINQFAVRFAFNFSA